MLYYFKNYLKVATRQFIYLQNLSTALNQSEQQNQQMQSRCINLDSNIFMIGHLFGRCSNGKISKSSFAAFPYVNIRAYDGIMNLGNVLIVSSMMMMILISQRNLNRRILTKLISGDENKPI